MPGSPGGGVEPTIGSISAHQVRAARLDHVVPQVEVSEAADRHGHDADELEASPGRPPVPAEGRPRPAR